MSSLKEKQRKILSLYSFKSVKHIADLTQLPDSYIYYTVWSLTSPLVSFWSLKETDYLKSSYSSVSLDSLSVSLSKSKDEISFKALHLNLIKTGPLSARDHNFLVSRLNEGHKVIKLSYLLGVTKDFLISYCNSKDINYGKRQWSCKEKEELIYLLSKPGNYTYFHLSKVFNTTISRVRYICSKLSLSSSVKKTNSVGNEVLEFVLSSLYPNYLIVLEQPIINNLRLDAYVPDLNLAFEFDGIQHFQEVAFFKSDHTDSLLVQQNNDRIKDNFCADKGIVLIRIKDINRLNEETLSALIAEGKELLNFKPQQKLKKKKSQLEQAKAYRKKQYRKQKEYAKKNR